MVNNNIILIDAYNEMRGKGLAPLEAALETGCLRLRPVLLTAITTVLGLVPMVLFDDVYDNPREFVANRQAYTFLDVRNNFV